MVKIPYIINQRGDRELFSSKKVYRAAKNVGASNQLAKEISESIATMAKDGITTSDIYRQVRALLRKQTPVAAIKFSLKEAMRKMGPAGFYFEKFIGAVYEEAGYSVKINQTVPGKCIRDYEIDFVAKKASKNSTLTILKIGECKYRNKPGDKIDLTIALSNHARFLDIKTGNFLNNEQGTETKSVLVTNTKFSRHAIKYSKCMDVELLGWNYPAGKGLERLIDKHKLYPVTILPSLNKHLADILAQKGIMLVKDIATLSGARFDKLKREATALLGS